MEDQRAIALTGISKVYATGTRALQDFNLTVQTGEFVSLVGPSGCGKSTVLQLIAGLSTPSEGTVNIGSNGEQPQLAFVFQDPALMPWASVSDNVQLPLKLRGTPQTIAQIKATDALKRVGLTSVERAYPRQLSGGMKMRVSLARALVTEPDLLLMDEPFGALDEITRSQLNDDLLTLWHQRHWTVVFVTHNIYEAVYLSNRVVILASHPGRAIAQIPIDLPYPRTQDLRTRSIYGTHCQQVAEHLAQAIALSPIP